MYNSKEAKMIVLKHVGYNLTDSNELKSLLAHLNQTTSQIDGVVLKEIYFPKGKEEFVLLLDCVSEEKYLEWREICPPPPETSDWYEVFLTKEEQFPDN
jgi:hypothetical protein